MRKNFYYSRTGKFYLRVRRTRRHVNYGKYDESLIMLAVITAFVIALAIAYVAIEIAY